MTSWSAFHSHFGFFHLFTTSFDTPSVVLVHLYFLFFWFNLHLSDNFFSLLSHGIDNFKSDYRCRSEYTVWCLVLCLRNDEQHTAATPVLKVEKFLFSCMWHEKKTKAHTEFLFACNDRISLSNAFFTELFNMYIFLFFLSSPSVGCSSSLANVWPKFIVL